MGRANLRDRAGGIVAALCLQAGFVAILFASLPHRLPINTFARETIWVLPRLIVPPPQIIDAQGKAKPSSGPATAMPSAAVSPAPIAGLSQAPTTPAAPDIPALGQALFGCAPEHYADLSAEQRRHCVSPGDGMAKLDGPSLIPAPSHAKDDALWQEEWAEAQWMPMCINAESLAHCEMDQSRDERRRARAVRQHLDAAKAAALREPKPVLPK